MEEEGFTLNYTSTMVSNSSFFNSSENTQNGTLHWFRLWQVPLVIFLSCLLAAIVIGNSCVLAAISLSDNGRKTRMNFFIMHLAIADLCVGLMVVSLDIGEMLSITWLAGSVLCKVLNFIKAFVTYASTYVLVSLSIDRFDAIARPMNFTGRKFRARLLIFTAWILAAMFSIPSLVLFEERPEMRAGNRSMCTIMLSEDWHWKVYITLIALATFILPATIITICYSVIISIVWRKSQTSSECEDVTSAGQDDRGQGEDISRKRLWIPWLVYIGLSKTVTLESKDIHYRRGITSNLIQQAKIRTIKMTFIIVLVFVICWCPFFVFNLLYVFVFNDWPESEGLLITNVLMQRLAPLNSAMNPIIYGVFSTRICSNLRRIRFIDCIARLVCPCPLKRNKGEGRASRASWNDPTLMTEGSTKSTHKSLGGMKRTFSDESPIQSKKSLPLSHNGKRVLFRSALTNGCYSDPTSKPRRFRRPSGLPLVKRALTEEDTNLLKAITFKGQNCSKMEESKI